MDPFEAAGADFFLHELDASGDLVGGLNVVDLDVHDANAEGDFGVDVFEGFEVFDRTVGELEDEVVAVEGAEEIGEGFPVAGLNGLAAVVAEAEVDGTLGAGGDSVEDAVHGFSGEGGIGGVAGDVGLIDLDTGGGQAGHLGGENVGDGEGEVAEISVVMVEQGARQHVGAGDGELERASGDGGGAAAIGEEVERAFAEGGLDDAGGFGAEAHGRVAFELLGGGAADGAGDARHRADKVFNHTVGVRMIDVEAVEFAVGGEIDAGVALDVEDNAGGVDDGELAGERGEPFRHGVGTDGGGLDEGNRHSV